MKGARTRILRNIISISDCYTKDDRHLYKTHGVLNHPRSKISQVLHSPEYIDTILGDQSIDDIHYCAKCPCTTGSITDKRNGNDVKGCFRAGNWLIYLQWTMIVGLFACRTVNLRSDMIASTNEVLEGQIVVGQSLNWYCTTLWKYVNIQFTSVK